MRRIGLAVILTIGLAVAPLVAEGQRSGEVYRIGFLSLDSETEVLGVWLWRERRE
jgi:hypothetical protein